MSGEQVWKTLTAPAYSLSTQSCLGSEDRGGTQQGTAKQLEAQLWFRICTQQNTQSRPRIHASHTKDKMPRNKHLTMHKVGERKRKECQQELSKYASLYQDRVTQSEKRCQFPMSQFTSLM